MRPCVYGSRGALNSEAAGARSISRPAYMTAISSASSTSKERSCVMKRAAKAEPVAQADQLLEDLPLGDDVRAVVGSSGS